MLALAAASLGHVVVRSEAWRERSREFVVNGFARGGRWCGFGTEVPGSRGMGIIVVYDGMMLHLKKVEKDQTM